ncbi:MAG: BON domain-containing protein [Granulosicoccaceae bacterium]
MTLRILASALVLAAVTAAPASAMVSKQNLDAVLDSAVFNSDISNVVNGDTVTLSGVIEGSYNANKARQAALSIEGVNKVISQFSYTGSR